MSKISELSDGGSLVSSDYLIAVRSGGNVKVRMDQINVDQVDLGDNEFIRLGNSQDLTMVHTSTQSIINQAGIGDLLLQKAGATKLTINATGIDVTGTVTADGLSVDGDSTVDAITYTASSSFPTTGVTLNTNGFSYEMAGAQGKIFRSASNTKALMEITNDGDISFYEDTGTTSKFFWDASAESLGIGGSPSYPFHVTGSGDTVAAVTAGASSIAALNLGNSTNLADGGIRYDNGADALILRASNAERMRIDASGNVLVGASSASGKLSVGTFGDTARAAQFHGGSIAIDGGAATEIIIGDGNVAYMSIHTTDNATAMKIRNHSGDADLVTIERASGNVGIGTPTITSGFKLEVTGDARFGDAVGDDAVEIGWSSGGAQGFIQAYDRGASAFRPLNINNSLTIDASGNLLVSDTTANPSGDNVDSGIALHNAGLVRASTNNAAAPLDLNIKGRDGIIADFRKDGTTVGSIGSLSGIVTEIVLDPRTDGASLTGGTNKISPGNQSGALDAHLDLGSSGTRFKDLYLSGDTFVGEPSTIGTGETGVTVRGLGQIRVGRSGTSSATLVSFNNGNGEVGTITTSGSATAYNTSSDYRLKENVVAIAGATARLKQLKPKRFNFIADSDTTVDGFLAHEVAEVIPEAVTGAKDAVDDDGNAVYQGIDQSKLVPLLVATIQELEARIAALES